MPPGLREGAGIPSCRIGLSPAGEGEGVGKAGVGETVLVIHAAMDI